MVILIASQFGFALNNNRSYISSTNFLSYRLIKYYRGKHCGKYSSGHEAVKVSDGVIMANDDMIVDQVETADGDIARDHAIILNHIPLAHSNRLLINIKQRRIDEVGK